MTLTVCCRPKILLPWQHDVTTSPLNRAECGKSVLGLAYFIFPQMIMATTLSLPGHNRHTGVLWEVRCCNLFTRDTLWDRKNSFKGVRAFRTELEFGSVDFWERGKTGVLEKPLGAKERTNNKLNLHNYGRWRQNLNPGHIGGWRVFSLMHPCSSFFKNVPLPLCLLRLSLHHERLR